jgi:hypothetical protein
LLININLKKKPILKLIQVQAKLDLINIDSYIRRTLLLVRLATLKLLLRQRKPPSIVGALREKRCSHNR